MSRLGEILGMVWRVWVIAVAFLFASPVFATDLSPLSTTAIGITGDVKFNMDKIVFDSGRSYRIANLRSLSADELDGVYELTGWRTFTDAALYKISIPAKTKMRNGNTICGREAVTKMIAARGSDSGRKQWSLIFFSGSREPFFPGWKEAADAGVCGSFNFVAND